MRIKVGGGLYRGGSKPYIGNSRKEKLLPGAAVLITHALQMLALSGNLLDDGSEMIVCPPSPHSSSVASTVFR